MPRLQDLIKNRKIYIAKMSKWPDKKLSKYIDVVSEQIGWAWQQKNADALETLNEMWRQIIEARLNVNFPADRRHSKAIDAAVYALYGLTEEEIKTVEGE